MKKLLLGFMVCGAALLGAAGDGIQTFTFGDLKFTAFQDTPVNMPASLFRNADKEVLKKLVPDGKAEASVNAFLLRLNGKNILVDSGNGGGRGSLSAKMKQAGIAPDKIDTILLTHMHGDHIGGLVDGGKAVFPKADVYVSEPELAYWKSSGNQLVGRVLKAYGDRIKTFKLDSAVVPGIAGLSAKGHTPGHTVYELDSIMIIGDLLHAAAIQFPHPEFCPAYDMDAAEAVATRLKFYDKAVQSGKPVAGMHLPFPGVGVITRDKSGAYVFKPVTP